MEVLLTDPEGLLDDSLKGWVHGKLASLSSHLDLATSSAAVFATDLRRRPHPQVVARLTLHTTSYRLPDLRAHASGSDAHTAFEAAFIKLDTEARRLKARITDPRA